MNIIEKCKIIFKAIKNSNMHTMLSSTKNLYILYGWHGVKKGITNKAKGKSLIWGLENDCNDNQSIREKKLSSLYVNINDEKGLADQRNLYTFIIIYKEDNFFKEINNTINSIKKQKYQTWECIILINTKKDNIAKKLKNILKKDKRITINVIEEFTERNELIKYGVEIAKGEWISFITPGDFIDKILLYWFYQNNKSLQTYDVVYFDECIVDQKNNIIDFCEKNEWKNKYVFSYNDIGNTSFYKKGILIGVPLTLFTDEYQYEIAAKLNNNKGYYCRYPLVFTLNKNFYWQNNEKRIEDRNKIIYQALLNKNNNVEIKYEAGKWNYKLNKENEKINIVGMVYSENKLENYIQCLLKYLDDVNGEVILIISRNKILADIIKKYSPKIKFIISDNFYDKDTWDKVLEKSDGDKLLLFFNEDIIPNKFNESELRVLAAILSLSGIGAVSPVVIHKDKTIKYCGDFFNIEGENRLTGSKYIGKSVNALDRTNNIRVCDILSQDIIAINKDDLCSVLFGFNEKEYNNNLFVPKLSLGLQEKEKVCTCFYGPVYYDFNTKKKNYILDLLKFYNNNILVNRECVSYGNDGYEVYSKRKFERFSDEIKNIIVFTHEFSYTGAPMVILDTVKEMVQMGYFVTVISAVDGPLRNIFIDNGAMVIIDKKIARGRFKNVEYSCWNDNWYIDDLVHECDLMFVNTMCGHNLINRYSGWNIPILWWLHEGSYTLDFMKQYLLPSLGSNVKVLCGGGYVQNTLKKYDINYITEVLLYGVEDKSNLYKKICNKNKKVKFLLAGTIEKRKGQHILLDAIENLSEEYKNKAEFIFIGTMFNPNTEQWIYDKLMKAVKNNENIVYKKTISRQKLFDLYQEIDCLVCPSFDDPMPVVVTEAMMFSKICICSTKVGTSYYIKNGENGYVFDINGEINELTKILSDIIKGYPQLGFVGKNARTTYENYFSMDKFNDNLKIILKTLEERT